MSGRSRAALLLGLLLAAPSALAQPVAVRAPQTIRPDADDTLQDAASVVVVNALEHQGEGGIKLFGAAGGDPAMNGLHTYLAFFMPPPENGWRVFEIGDFLTYEIVSEGPGRVLLEVNESVMNDATGEIGSRVRRIALSWAPGPDGAPPETVTAAPAR
jgi:hypothetical protein